MSVIRVGATKKFADNWENIFGGKKKSAGKSSAKSPHKKVTSKLAAKKRSAKKKARLQGK
jgi:hypothetical protein